MRELAKGRPTVLVTGSATCPLTVSALPDLNRLQKRYGSDVLFALLQVREAHPGQAIGQPQTTQEKIEHAQMLRQAHGVSWPVLIDDIEGSLHQMLDSMPNSLHIIGANGEVLYRTLFAADDGVEKAIASVAAGERPTKKSSQNMLAVLKSAGYMDETLKSAGKGAYLDVLKGAPSMVALALGTKLFPFVSKANRGFALVIATVVLSAAAVAVLALS